MLAPKTKYAQCMKMPDSKNSPTSELTVTFNVATHQKTSALNPSLLQNIIPPLSSKSPTNPTTIQKNISFTNHINPPVHQTPSPTQKLHTPKIQLHHLHARLRQLDNKLSLQYGKYPSQTSLMLSEFGRPSRAHSFTSDVTFDHILIFLFKSKFLSHPSTSTVTSSHPLYLHLYHSIRKFESVDFSTLSTINTAYKDQLEIPLLRKQKFIAAILHYNFRLSTVVRFLGNNYTNGHLNPTTLARRLHHKVPGDIIKYIIRALTIGAPSKISGHSTTKNFWDYKRYGNHASILSKPNLVHKAMNKEERNNYAFPLPSWMARFLYNFHLSPEGIIVKEGKKDRIIFDASFKIHPQSACPNDWTNKYDEPPIWYGSAFYRHLIRVWNLRISYPYCDIFLWDDDVSGAFRLVKYNPEVVGAFAANLFGSIWIPTGQIFGGNTSAQNFEGFAKAREHLSEYYSNTQFLFLIQKHHSILKLITYEKEESPSFPYVQASPDTTHQGVFNSINQPLNTPHNTFVDDNHMADVVPRIRLAQAASIEGLFSILGTPSPHLRRTVLSEDKYYEQKCGPEKIQLGYLVNTRKMTVGFTEKRLLDLHSQLSIWAHKRKSYSIKEAAKLAGNIEFIASTTVWLRFLTIALKHSILKALRANTTSIHNNSKFTSLVHDSHLLSLDFESIRKKDFAVSKVLQSIWASKKKFHITKSLRTELKLILYLFSNRSAFPFATPIAHVIPRDPEFQALGDACLDGAGGFSTNMKFWWYVDWPPAIASRTLKHFVKKYKGLQNQLLSINLLEYVAILISYAAAIQSLRTFSYSLPHPNPTINILSDNTTALSWTKRAASSTAEGKALAFLMTSLMIHNSSLHLSATFIPGSDNKIADSISRMQTSKQKLTFSQLSQKYPPLTACRRFHPSPELLSNIWDALLSQQAHPLEQIAVLGHFSPAT